MSGIAKWEKIFYIYSFIFILSCTAFISHVWILRWNRRAVDLADLEAEGGPSSLIWAAAYIFDVITGLIFTNVITSVSCLEPLKKRRHLQIYVGAAILTLILQIIAGSLAAVYKQESLAHLESAVNRTVFDLYGSPGHDEITESYDMVQRKFECCGATVGPQDWQMTHWYNQTEGEKAVPISCCVLSNRVKYDDPPAPVDQRKCESYAQHPEDVHAHEFLNLEPCERRIRLWMVAVTDTFMGVSFGFIPIPVVAIAIVTTAYKTGVRYQIIV